MVLFIHTEKGNEILRETAYGGFQAVNNITGISKHLQQ